MLLLLAAMSAPRGEWTIAAPQVGGGGFVAIYSNVQPLRGVDHHCTVGCGEVPWGVYGNVCPPRGAGHCYAVGCSEMPWGVGSDVHPPRGAGHCHATGCGEVTLPSVAISAPQGKQTIDMLQVGGGSSLPS